ncbi:hypothetical protein KCU67_g9706, partial [Aureobasidium melanogenum]
MLISPRVKQSADDKTSTGSLRNKPVIVLCKDYISARILKGSRIEQLVHGRVEYVAQPCGPNRLASIIYRILEHSEDEDIWKSVPISPLTPNTPHGSMTPRFDTWRESHVWSGASSPNETEMTRRLSLRSRRPSNDINQPVSSTSTQEKAGVQDSQLDGMGIDMVSKPPLPEVADGALTAASLAQLEPQVPHTRNQSVISMSTVVALPVEPSKPCLLLVDDNPINLQLLVSYAKKNGHAMHKASDGQQAVEAYTNAHLEGSTTDKPEVVLMDISMPVMDGFEASRQIRAFERQKGMKPVVIIALTGLGSSEAQHEAFVSGINLFLTKPVRLKELTRLLGTIKETFG